MLNIKIIENTRNLITSGILELKSIYVFGANNYTKDIIKVLSENNYHLTSILDNAPDKQNMLIEGIPVVDPSYLSDTPFNKIILIASGYYYEMIAQIKDFGFEPDINVFNLMPVFSSDDVKSFYTTRAEIDISKLDKIENIVHFFKDETNAEAQEMMYKLQDECILKHFHLHHNNVLVDLGAGIGQYSRLLAPYVKKVYAVEQIEKLNEIGRQITYEQGISNIEFISESAESFSPTNIYIDRVLISGLLCLLDDDQYIKVINNVKNYLTKQGDLFLREPVSINGFKFIKPSENNFYPTIYRTPQAIIDSISKYGFILKECGQFFDDNSSFNDNPVAILYYFRFTKY